MTAPRWILLKNAVAGLRSMREGARTPKARLKSVMRRAETHDTGRADARLRKFSWEERP